MLRQLRYQRPSAGKGHFIDLIVGHGRGQLSTLTLELRPQRPPSRPQNDDGATAPLHDAATLLSGLATVKALGVHQPKQVKAIARSLLLCRAKQRHGGGQDDRTVFSTAKPSWASPLPDEPRQQTRIAVGCRRPADPRHAPRVACCHGLASRLPSASLLKGKPVQYRRCPAAVTEYESPNQPLVVPRRHRWEGGLVGRSGSQNTHGEPVQNSGLPQPTIHGAKTPSWCHVDEFEARHTRAIARLRLDPPGPGPSKAAPITQPRDQVAWRGCAHRRLAPQ